MEEGRCTIATLRVGTLHGRGETLLDWMEAEQVDTLCVQEHRVPMTGRKRFDIMAKERGYAIHWGEDDSDRRGDPVRGVAIITRQAGYRVKERGMPDARRVLA